VKVAYVPLRLRCCLNHQLAAVLSPQDTNTYQQYQHSNKIFRDVGEISSMVLAEDIFQKLVNFEEARW